MKDLIQITLESHGSVTIQRCFHQIFKPKESYAQAREGKGNCYDCVFHPKENRQCKGYQPVMVTYVLREEVK